MNGAFVSTLYPPSSISFITMTCSCPQRNPDVNHPHPHPPFPTLSPTHSIPPPLTYISPLRKRPPGIYQKSNLETL